MGGQELVNITATTNAKKFHQLQRIRRMENTNITCDAIIRETSLGPANETINKSTSEWPTSRQEQHALNLVLPAGEQE